VNGCFWHGHGCHLFKQPESRTAFWCNKIEVNRKRDDSNLRALTEMGWRTCIVWECALRGKQRLSPTEMEARLSRWLLSGEQTGSIEGSG
jgi:DNA mismatch endonuclease (patch repair protein)